MKRIDAHQHFWQYDARAYSWINPASVLAATHEPADLKPLIEAAGIDGCIAVQARQDAAETRWLIDLAAAHPWIVGVVGWVDLRADDIAERLSAAPAGAPIVGYRHVVQDEQEDDFLLTPAFVRGVRAVLAHGLAYDILITPRQASHVRRFAEMAGYGRLILDHGAKPNIAAGDWQPWAASIADMAQVPTIFCKVSGLVTEADHAAWTPDDIARYLDHLLGCFGPDRLIFGSDWPVCRLAADYVRVHDLIAGFVARHCPDHAGAIFGGNAERAYALGSAS
ncbi:amidohydrolase family protein [Sphingomonas sp.]|jgi:L-fuconolactonase|uniref:amidohydrolase family protein n=1 Tax=Sphingomonas sp. TaxID=28214 RepID=UPI002EDAC6CA